MAKSCFHRRPFVIPVKSPSSTTGSLVTVNGINKVVSGARLLLITVSTYPWIESVSVTYRRHSTTACVLMESITRLWLPTHSHCPPHPLLPAHPIPSYPPTLYNVPSVILQLL